MNKKYKIISHKDLDKNEINTQQFANDVLLGLSEKNKILSPKYFYDDEGSKLFEKIMDLPEYYLTNMERDIFLKEKEKIAAVLGGQKFNLIELGAGDGRKTHILIEEFLKQNLQFNYVPVDISESAMKGLIESVCHRFPELEAQGLVADYFDGIRWLTGKNNNKNVVFFLGSNLGNFSYSESRVFIHSLWNSLNEGDLLFIGFDLKKDIDVMLDAYNDKEGITARFNLNLLTRINRELGGQFDITKFRHFETYDVFSGAMESYLVSLEKQEIFIKELGKCFSFNAWEPIHTEYSYKYLLSDITSLASDTGFEIVKNYFDEKYWFVDSLWKVKKGNMACT